MFGGNVSKVVNDSKVGLTAAGCGDDINGFVVGGDVYPPLPEFRSTVYCD